MPGRNVRSVCLASPEHEKDITLSFRQAGGELTFTVPEVRTYEIAVVEFDGNSLQAILKRPIIGPTLPMIEVQRHCEARVPRMPAVVSVAQWEAESNRLRAAILDHVVFRGEAARWRDAPVKTEWLESLPGEPGYHIRKLRFEAACRACGSPRCSTCRND